MKIVALLLARNEERVLPTYLSSVKPVADEIVAIDDRSTDRTRAILEAAGVKVYPSLETVGGGWNEAAARQRLLGLGRESGGTHFICLDADEALSGNFIPKARAKIISLRPGQKLVLRWPFLWKNSNNYVDDAACEFTNLYKDFIFCDRADMNFSDSFLHFGKTPGPNAPENLINLPDSEGVCLHFAYEDFAGALLRQAWYRCMELIKQPKNFVKINNRYYLAAQGKNFKTKAVPSEWLKNLVLPPEPFGIQNHWRFIAIKNWLKEFGPEFFEKLEIWDMPELKEEFVKMTGRPPQSSRLHIYLRPVIKFKRWLKKYIK